MAAAAASIWPGAVTARDLRTALRDAGLPGTICSLRRAPAGLLAPGLLTQHYSPDTPLQVCRKLPGQPTWKANPRTAYIFWCRPEATTGANVLWLTKRGKASEAAQNLYAVLRQADAGGFKRILVELNPARQDPLAPALADRLRRAAGRRTR